MNLQESLAAIWRRRLLVVALVVVALVAVGTLGMPGERQPSYTASVTLGVTADSPPELVLLYAQIANDTAEIRERVVADLGEGLFAGRSAQAVLAETVTVTADDQIGLLVVTATDQESLSAARAVIDTYAAHLLAYSGEEQIEERDRQLAAARDRAAELEERIGELTGELESLAAGQTAEERAAGLEVDTIRQAEYDVARDQYRELTSEIEDLVNQSDEDLMTLRRISEPTVVDTSTDAALGAGGRLLVAAGLSALLGVGLALGLARLDSRLYRRRDVEAAYRLPVLAQVPRVGRRSGRTDPVIVATRPEDGASEAFRVLRSGLERARTRQDVLVGAAADGAAGTVVVVVSASGGVGRTTAVANLAAAAAAAGMRVLVVGADLRGREVGALFGVDADRPGLSDAVVAAAAGRGVTLADHVVGTGVVGVDLLPTGLVRGNPGETLAASRFLFEEARAAYDLVVVDTPPMLVGSDVNELVPVADLVLVVARVGSSTVDEGRWVDEMAGRLQAPTCGVVLIGAEAELSRPGLAGRLRGVRRPRRPGVSPRSLAELADAMGGDASATGSAGGIGATDAAAADGDVGVADRGVEGAPVGSGRGSGEGGGVDRGVGGVPVGSGRDVEDAVGVERGGEAGTAAAGGGEGEHHGPGAARKEPPVSGSWAVVRVGSGRSAEPASLIDV